MQYNQIGHSDLMVSYVGLGAMSLRSEEDIRTNQYILDHAQSLGINYLDTADLYERGKNEELLGKLIKGKRENWILASKVGNVWNQNESTWTWAPTKAYIIKAVEDSLCRLNTDYLDLYQLHGGTIHDPIEEIIEAFETLVEQGKIRYYGLSSIRANVFLKYINRSNIVSNMMQYSMYDRRAEDYFDQIEKANVSVLARGTLAQGLLLGKPAQSYLNYTDQQVMLIQKKIEEISRELDVSKLAIALKFPLVNKAICCSVLGIRTKVQVYDLAQALLDMKKLTASSYSQILNLLPKNHYTDHLV